MPEKDGVSEIKVEESAYLSDDRSTTTGKTGRSGFSRISWTRVYVTPKTDDEALLETEYTQWLLIRRNLKAFFAQGVLSGEAFQEKIKYLDKTYAKVLEEKGVKPNGGRS